MRLKKIIAVVLFTLIGSALFLGHLGAQEKISLKKITEDSDLIILGTILSEKEHREVFAENWSGAIGSARIRADAILKGTTENNGLMDINGIPVDDTKERNRKAIFFLNTKEGSLDCTLKIVIKNNDMAALDVDDIYAWANEHNQISRDKLIHLIRGYVLDGQIREENNVERSR